MAVSVDDFRTYLSDDNLDAVRVSYILVQATTLCESVVNPLPDGADSVVVDVAARAWANPLNVSAQAAGPFSVSGGPVSGGLWLTRQNKATLRRLAGSGGAFTIDVLPVGAGTNLPWWDSGIAVDDSGDFDVPS